MSVDPHASKYPEWSPYNYVYNNPLSTVDPNGKDGFKLGIGFIGGGPFLNVKVGISMVYNENTGFKVLGSSGIGLSNYTQGIGGGVYLTVGYTPGEFGAGSSSYAFGAIGEGASFEITATTTTDAIQEVNGVLPTGNEVNNIINNGNIELGVGVGAGALSGVGVEGCQTLLDFSHSPTNNIDLNNQNGQAPADNTNVVPVVTDDDLEQELIKIMSYD